jgi:hypothetical protein
LMDGDVQMFLSNEKSSSLHHDSIYFRLRRNNIKNKNSSQDRFNPGKPKSSFLHFLIITFVF